MRTSADGLASGRRYRGRGTGEGRGGRWGGGEGEETVGSRTSQIPRHAGKHR